MTDTLVRDAERIVLGSLLLDPSTIQPVVDVLRGKDFADIRHESIFATITAQHAADLDTGPVAIALALQGVGELGRVGGAPYLHDCVASVPTTVQVGYYAGLVAEAARVRRVVTDAARLSQAAESGDMDRVRAIQSSLAEQWGIQATAVDGDSWAPIDLDPYLRGEIEQPEPTVGIVRSDGLRLLYPGREHAVIGEMESGKTWWSAACVAGEMSWNRHVLYVHFEETDPGDLIGRLRALGVSDAEMSKLLRFVAPARPVTPEGLARLLQPAPSLVVFDGVNEAMSLHGWGIREEDGAAKFRRHLIMPCVRVGAATLSCDHVVKSVEARGRHALGSIHKGNGITGSLILLENAEPFGRGARGVSHVFVTKDRPGHLRRHGRPDAKTPGKTYMGALVVDDTQLMTPDLDVRFWAPSTASAETAAPDADPKRIERQDVDEQVYAVVVALAVAGAPATGRAVRAKSTFGNEKTADALARLVLAGRLVERDGPRNARIYSPTGPEDPHSEPSPTGPAERVVRSCPTDRDRDRTTRDRSPAVPEPVGTTQDHSTEGRGHDSAADAA